MTLRALAAALLVAAPAMARGYRPFDQTDAAVAPPRVVELELGPIDWVRAGGAGSLAPNFTFNYGVADRLELVVDGRSRLRLASQAPGERSDVSAAVLLKGVVRRGALQDAPGPSVALEAGVLLPSWPGGGGAGASLAGIVSYRWPALTVHANLEGAVTREHDLDAVGGAILEGPDAWIVRPVAEGWVERVAGRSDVSGLAATIWRVGEALALDAAARVGREEGVRVVELRAGLTWAFSP